MVRLFHRENECYVCAEGSFADVERAVDRKNECYIPPEGSQVEGDVVQLFHPENESDEGSFVNGEKRILLMVHACIDETTV